MKLSKNGDFAKQIKEEEEKKMAKDFKLKLTERIQNKALPKLARLREDNFLECIICKFASIEDLSFKKHYVALPHKKALEEFQKNYEKKKNPKEKKIIEPTKEKKKETIGVVVGAKRPHNLDYKLEETYVMIESTENGEVNNPSSFKTKDENLDKVLNTETNNLKLSEPITEYDIKIMEKAPKIIKEENKEEEDNNDEEIEKNLNRILEEEEDDLNKIIKNNLKMKKKQIKNKKDEINIENNTEGEDKNEKINTEKIFDLEIFNWKKKKLF